jgi:RimJ/RimL family protein N-acetyltransferase
VREPPLIRTERLLMRAPRLEDYDRWVEIFADPDVGAGLRGEHRPMTPHEAWVDLSMLTGHWALRGFGHWVLEELDGGAVVGRAGLYHPPDWPGMEVGWTIAREDRGKGYAVEAARAACEWAHGELGAKHILSLILPANTQSARVAQNLGLTHEGEHSTRGFTLDVFGADLPLSGSVAQRAGTRAQ